jgi:hypothetical protein
MFFQKKKKLKKLLLSVELNMHAIDSLLPHKLLISEQLNEKAEIQWLTVTSQMCLIEDKELKE